MMAWVPIVLAVAPVAVPAQAQAQAQVEAAMRDSAEGWNHGDLDRFVAIYADQPTTSFVTSRGLVRGRAAIARRYAPSFTGSKAADRGRLTFRTLDFRLLDPTHALYIGQYRLTPTRPGGKVQSGPTSLVFERTRTGWKIVADHSS